MKIIETQILRIDSNWREVYKAEYIMYFDSRFPTVKHMYFFKDRNGSIWEISEEKYLKYLEDTNTYIKL